MNIAAQLNHQAANLTKLDQFRKLIDGRSRYLLTRCHLVLRGDVLEITPDLSIERAAYVFAELAYRKDTIASRAAKKCGFRVCFRTEAAGEYWPS